MCGIVAVVGASGTEDDVRKQMLDMARLIRHRGPDWSGLCIQKLDPSVQLASHANSPAPRFNALAHERLGIVSPESGAQPIYDEDGVIALAVNGEIYNHQELEKKLGQQHTFATGSDCEVIVHLFQEQGEALVDQLDGIFAFVLCDSRSGRVLAARDPIGVVPLYWGWGDDGSVWFASELKALATVCRRFEQFPPGHMFVDGQLQRYYHPRWKEARNATARPSLEQLRDALDTAVKKRLMCDVPYGVLISGGLDSSIVSALASRHARKRIEDGEASEAWYPRLHSFCIGLEGAPDLGHARDVARFLGTVHHEMTYTMQEGLDALPDVIYHIESYDVTTVRASTPMFLMARKIRALGIKMVLSGEGADEVFGGYLYFHKAPNAAELYAETVRKVEALHNYDCLRANKAMAAWGIETRVPFLDRHLLDLAMCIDPELKLPTASESKMEKHILRAAFDRDEDPYLPRSVLWRQKEQFSDGVGYGWIDGLRNYAEAQVTDELFATRAYRFPENTPRSKEGYLYRMIFEQHFPQPSAAATVPAEKSIACSSEAALRWEAQWADKADPSGRAIASHQAAYKD